MSMQLAEAIEGWMLAHSAGLSASTRRDIADIALAAKACGYGSLECIDLREPQRLAIIADADSRSSLNPQAIGQFLAIVVQWGVDEDQPQLFAPDPAPADPASADRLPSDTDEWLDEPDDLATGNWLTDSEPDPDDPAPNDAQHETDAWGTDDLGDDDFGGDDWGDEAHVAPVADRIDDYVAAPIIDDLDVAPDWVDELPPITDIDLRTGPHPDPVPFVPRSDREPKPTAFSNKTSTADEPAVEEPELEHASVDTLPADTLSADTLPNADDETVVAEDEQLIDEDDLDDDELQSIDADLHVTDENDLDDDELDLIDADLDDALPEPAVDEPEADEAPDLDDDLDDDTDETFDDDIELVIDGTDDVEMVIETPAVATAPPEAASFLRAIDQSTPSPNAFGDLASKPVAAKADDPEIDLTSRPTSDGIFSEAAQHEPGRSVDWITVAYFVVAAICFALVIYFYLSS